MTEVNYLLFDLDGTLTDPKTGIIRSIQHALSRLNRPVPEEDDLIWCIGPPLRQSFSILLSSSDTKLIEKAMDFYRERFGVIGLYENQVYPGVIEMLTELKQCGFSLYVATSKPEYYARIILEHFDLLKYFENVYGSEMDGKRDNKKDLLDYIIIHEALIPEKSMMIGDRLHDIVGAKHHGMIAGAVTYGYGMIEELKTAGADYMFHYPQEIVDFVKSIE